MLAVVQREAIQDAISFIESKDFSCSCNIIKSCDGRDTREYHRALIGELEQIPNPEDEEDYGDD